MKLRRKHKVRINYKSGRSVTIQCDEFTVRRDYMTGGVAEVSWDRAKPTPLQVGLEDVESVWQLR